MVRPAHLFRSILIIAAINACSDTNSTRPDNHFIMTGEPSFSLKDAVLYVVNEAEDGNGHRVRDYAITDGEYLDGDGLSFGDYTEATYLMVIRLGVPQEADGFAEADYRLYHDLASAPETANIAWVSFATTTNVYLEIPEDAQGQQHIKISGEADHGNTMILEFTGTMTDYSGEEVAAECTFYFKGKVKDLRFG